MKTIEELKEGVPERLKNGDYEWGINEAHVLSVRRTSRPKFLALTGTVVDELREGGWELVTISERPGQPKGKRVQIDFQRKEEGILA